MKKLITLFATLLTVFNLQAASFEEGKHYTVLSNDKSASPKVTEYFSFYCPHCFRFEPVIENLKAALPDGAKFDKVHVGFMGGNMAVPMAKSYATMVALDAEKTMVPAMFKQIHVLRRAPQNEAELKQLFVDNGIDGDKFDSAYNSFVVNSMQRSFDKQFINSTLTGVPGVVVNDKYIVKGDHVDSFEEYNELVNYLLTL